MIEPNNTQTRGQEVIFFNNDDDVETDAVNPTSIDVAAGVDAPTDIKRGLLTVKNAAYGCGILCFVSAIGFAAGVVFTGTTNTAIQANLLSEKMALDSERGTMTSGKSGKGQADFYQCIVEPFVSFGSMESLLETPTKKEFAENVWNPYIKKCGGFWCNIAYLLTRLVLYFMDQVISFIEDVKDFLGMNMIPSECTFLLPSLDPSNMFVSSILETEGDTLSFIEGVGDCVDVIYDLVMDRCF
mmetsp:Transcript_31644/g.53955  ORF Transcript_31644/g.53955 Transcript_31644/m.53955 type:complete len:242 (-) Transcript_31644:274-999(-)